MMKRSLIGPVVVVCVFFLGLTFIGPSVAKAQDHVVSPAEIQKDTAGASTARQQHILQLDGFFSTKEAQQALKSAHVDAQQVKDAVRQLDDDDLADLSARAQKAQSEFAAGTLSDRDLLIIVLVALAIILIVVAVR